MPIANDAIGISSIAPLAQGSTLGNKGNIIDDAQTGQKLYRWEEMLLPLPGRKHRTAYNTHVLR